MPSVRKHNFQNKFGKLKFASTVNLNAPQNNENSNKTDYKNLLKPLKYPCILSGDFPTNFSIGKKINAYI